MEPKIINKEGFEQNFATNTLSPFYMTNVFIDLLKKSSNDSRVIFVSSGGMRTETLDYNDLQWEKNKDKFDPTRQYAKNKRC